MAVGFCAVDENPPGPDQLKVGAVALVVALMVVELTAQVRIPPVVDTLGG